MSDFVDIVTPMWERIALYDKTRSPTDQPMNDAADAVKALPQGFIDAMIVREEVFVQEQGVALENELDEDDHRSFHWVAYASIPAKLSTPDITAQGAYAKNAARRVSNSTKIPIGTIRLVPPPHAPHPVPEPKTDGNDSPGNSNAGNDSPRTHDPREAYIKLGRLAVIPEFRKAGISKLLIETALAFAREKPYEITPSLDPAKYEASRQLSDRGGQGTDWRGLVLVHAQLGTQKVWQKYGFERDMSMGEWDEEGITHVGMWRRVGEGRRKSKAFLIGSPIGSP